MFREGEQEGAMHYFRTAMFGEQLAGRKALRCVLGSKVKTGRSIANMSLLKKCSASDAYSTINIALLRSDDLFGVRTHPLPQE